MSSSARRKFDTLDAGRGVAAVAVTLHHAAHLSLFQQHAAIARSFEGLALGVAYFFVLSGTVILLAHRRHIGVPSYALTYLRKRARRIYPIYWLAFASWLLLALRRTPPIWALTDGAVLLRFFADDYKCFPPSWTLYHEISFYMVFLALILHRRLGTILITVWWLAALLSLRISFLDFAAYPSSVQLLFGLGAVAGWWLSTGKQVRFPGVLAGSGALMLLVLCGLHWPMLQTTYLAAGAAAFLLILGAAELEATQRVRVPKLFLFLGSASYSIYLFHPLFQTLGSTLQRHVARHIALSDWVWLCILTLVSIAGSCAVHVWLERPLMQWVNRKG